VDKARGLTARYVSLQVLLSREALSAVRTENHGCGVARAAARTRIIDGRTATQACNVLFSKVFEENTASKVVEGLKMFPGDGEARRVVDCVRVLGSWGSKRMCLSMLVPAAQRERF
jgi:NifU-like protein involved in Fe-S cluster formation